MIQGIKVLPECQIIYERYNYIKFTSDPLKVAFINPFAICDDGVIEGFYVKDEPILAIQWHPERSNPSSGYDKSLINSFFNDGIFW